MEVRLLSIIGKQMKPIAYMYAMFDIGRDIVLFLFKCSSFLVRNAFTMVILFV